MAVVMWRVKKFVVLNAFTPEVKLSGVQQHKICLQVSATVTMTKKSIFIFL